MIFKYYLIILVIFKFYLIIPVIFKFYLIFPVIFKKFLIIPVVLHSLQEGGGTLNTPFGGFYFLSVAYHSLTLFIEYSMYSMVRNIQRKVYVRCVIIGVKISITHRFYILNWKSLGFFNHF